MPTDHQIIKRIIRVNHAGEHGAVSIYRRQIERAKKFNPDLLPWLEETLSHEIKHREQFQEAMLPRAAKPCRLMFIWAVGGSLLGWVSALFGRKGIFACTIAVEKTVHRHLKDQITYLNKVDRPLASIVTSVLEEEESHLTYAEQNKENYSFTTKLLEAFIALATELLILISTRGDNIRLSFLLSQK